MSLDPSAITPGFVEAVIVWSEYLVGQRNWGWGAAGAQHLFLESGIPVPTDPPSEAALIGLINISQGQDHGLFSPGSKTTIPPGSNLGEAIAYMINEFNNDLVVGGDTLAAHAPQTVQDAVEDLKAADPASYMNPPAPQFSGDPPANYSDIPAELNKQEGYDLAPIPSDESLANGDAFPGNGGE